MAPRVACMFSRRVPADLAPNRIAAATAVAGEVPFDLTVSNPTVCGLPYPASLLQPLADAAGLSYRPDPRGLAVARAAVAREYARQGAAVDPRQVVLTASTSEAYAFLFKLLCEPGESVLVPSPSYPLFEHLARVEGVVAREYALDAEHGWAVDVPSLAGAPATTRAVVVVHPNNPTGSFVSPEDARALAAVCAEREWALIADEVFLDYPLSTGATPPTSFAASAAALTFTLGGLSKSLGLPQLKLAWICVGGPPALTEAALKRLEFIADTFLSVATPVQLALPTLLRDAAGVRAAISDRCRSNLAALRALAHSHPAVEVLPPGGGWSAVLRIPAVIPEEELVLELLRSDGVAVHPGYFFDFPRDGMLVVSLLPSPELFTAGVARVLARVAALL